MTSSNLNNRPSDNPYKADGVWHGPSGDVLIEVKRTNNARDIRSALMALAYLLADESDTTHALCVLTQSKLSPKRLQEELERFRWLVRRDVGGRIELDRYEDIEREQGSSIIGHDPAFMSWITDLVASEVSGSRFSRQAVMSVMALLWLRGVGPMTAKSLQEKCGASYPTVAAAISELSKQDLIEQQSDRRVSLRYLPVDRWVQMAQKHADGRKIHRYVDPTGQTRTPEVLMARLFKLQQQGTAQQVGVGGVLGARRYFPDLDITASPRLDLSVYGDGDLEFVRRLDAALEPTTDSRAKAHVIVHVTAEPENFLERDSGGSWASEMECSADLLELGLVREAHEMFETLRQRRTGKWEDETR
jgi:hypothetical protein